MARQGLPVSVCSQKRLDFVALCQAPIDDGQGIAADDLAVVIGVAVAGSGLAFRDVAHDWTGIAADFLRAVHD